MSPKAIQNAKKKANKMIVGTYYFTEGSIEGFEKIKSASVEAVILSNILDNLYPEDMDKLLMETDRVLKKGGKVLVKVNDYITHEQIKAWNIKIIEGNLLDDGFILLNHTTEEWKHIFEKRFSVENFEEIYFPEFEQSNRMFFLRK